MMRTKAWLQAIGVDNNPLAVQLSKAKIHKEVGSIKNVSI